MRTQSGVAATAMALKPIKMQLVGWTQLPQVCFRTTTGRQSIIHRKKLKTPRLRSKINHEAFP
jgi:hypothetical protein